MKIFPFYKQHDAMDCGPTCLKMVTSFYGKKIKIQRLRELCEINKNGVSILGISEAAEKIGLRTLSVNLTHDMLMQAELPCILHWNQNHFVILYRVSKGEYYVADPAYGLIKYKKDEFLRYWSTTGIKSVGEGIALLISVSPKFYMELESTDDISLPYVTRYLFKYKKLILQLFLGFAVGSIIQLILPFLAQSVVDIGINTRDLNFIYIILIAQTALFLGRLSVDFIRSWILLHITTRINIAILTDFLIKLMKLPMGFFDVKLPGDIMQRISDQKRIESFITGPTLNTIFALFNMIIFSGVLLYYNLNIFYIFLFSTTLYSFWILIFLKKRRELDKKRFDISSKSQGNIIQLIQGMQEIKLNNNEQQKRWEWENIQASVFRYNLKSLSLSQYEQAGGFFINEGKNIFITFLIAKTVINGNLTLGGMVAIQYILGQLSSPIEQLIGFFQQFQDAKISLERLNEIHQMKDEEDSNTIYLKELPTDKSIFLNNLSFTYPGAGNQAVLKGIYLKIPEGKITAIVGMSGSGKTTILKLLLRFYQPQQGEITIGNNNIDNISFKFWRGNCGVVMQDGFIFSDTISKNIAVSDERPDRNRLNHAIRISNIQELIQELPLGLNTKIGSDGHGLSQGQKQRILIARAVYKNPEYIFFDEATNSLDSINESTILENMGTFFHGRTVVFVAHRLSTVRNADNIVVLDKGVIIEQGTHEYLLSLHGKYFSLIKSQIELIV